MRLDETTQVGGSGYQGLFTTVHKQNVDRSVAGEVARTRGV